MVQNFQPSPSLAMFGVHPGDPGYIYIVQSGPKIKVGKSICPEERLRAARTWLPEAEFWSPKPFWGHSEVEDAIHIGLTAFWDRGEWYEFEDKEFFVNFKTGFEAFSNSDINKNSIDFIYWMHGSGMAEFTLEQSEQGISKRKFLKGETG